MGCKSRPHCEFSTLASLCSGDSLYSMKLSSILSMAASRHIRGGLPQEPSTPSNTHGLFAYTSADIVGMQRPISAVMTWRNSLKGLYYQLWCVYRSLWMYPCMCATVNVSLKVLTRGHVWWNWCYSFLPLWAFVFFRCGRKSRLLFHELLPGWQLILQPATKEDRQE